jgi:hypothetical protein
MPVGAYWAYDFACDQSLEELLALFNRSGPWPWEMRESAWYGDYLSTRPARGVRVRVHQYPQAGEAGVFVGLRDRGFSALLQIGAEASAQRPEIDEVFRRLLSQARATGLTDIEPYD